MTPRVKMCRGKGRGDLRVECGRVLPADAEHFYHDPDLKDGLTSACQDCTKAYEALRTRRKRAKRREVADQAPPEPWPPLDPNLDARLANMVRLARHHNEDQLYDRRRTKDGAGWLHIYVDALGNTKTHGPYYYR